VNPSGIASASSSSGRERVRIGIGGFSHESNTFASRRANLDDFQRAGLFRGEEIERAFTGTQAVIAGYLEAADVLGFEVRPLFFAQANPMGAIEDETFERLAEELLAAVVAEGPLDALLLAQHGAAVARSYPDADGELLSRVRAAVGDIPIGVTLDLHANVTQRMVDASTVTVLYRTNPHLDTRDRGFECAELTYRTALGEISPEQALERPPTIVHILRQGTTDGPMAGLYEELEGMIGRGNLLTASIAEGYPWADVEEMGMSCLAVTDGDAAAARSAAQELAALVWRDRARLQAEPTTVEEAIRIAVEHQTGHPVLLLDAGDNVGAGSPGDSTTLLHAARTVGLRGVATTICDPAAAKACHESGLRSEVKLSIGGVGAAHDPPFPLAGVITALSNGSFQASGAVHGGVTSFELGLTAVVETDDGFTVLLCSNPVIDATSEPHRTLGVPLSRMRAIIARGVHSPLPAYAALVDETVNVGSPGVTSPDLTSFAYERRRRPLFPFEPDTAYVLPARSS
jgi:microcystin degradation protein MlrC